MQKDTSGGLSMGWRSRSIKLVNSWGFESGLGMTVRVEYIGRNFTILNVYRPSQERMQYWYNILAKYFTKERNLILGEI
jgi:hypothetical protein